MKRSYFDLEDRWVFLARSHMFTESLQDLADQRPQLNERVPVDPKLPVVGQLFDLLPVAIYVCDADGLIIHYNNHAAKLWGRSPKLNDPTDRFCGSYWNNTEGRLVAGLVGRGVPSVDITLAPGTTWVT